MKELVVYSGRNRPDLTPVYRLFERLTDTTVTVEKVYHLGVAQRVIDERNEPRTDLLLTNSQLALELVHQVLERRILLLEYHPAGARRYAG